MTANQATYAAMLAFDGAPSRRPDPVRARVGAGQQLVNSQRNRVGSADNRTAQAASEVQAEHRGLYLLADTRGTGPGGLHPGDVLYWVACLGGACLLLLLATT